MITQRVTLRRKPTQMHYRTLIRSKTGAALDPAVADSLLDWRSDTASRILSPWNKLSPTPPSWLQPALARRTQGLYTQRFPFPIDA